MNLYAKDYTFNGKKLSSFGDFMIGDFESSSSETVDIGLSKTLSTTDFSAYRDSRYYYNEKYESPLQFNIGIYYSNGNEFAPDIIRSLSRWMQCRGGFQSLTVADYDGVSTHENMVYYARCTNIQHFCVAKIVRGMIFSMECNAPYGYERQEFPFLSSNSTVKINTISDESDYIRPIIQFHANSTGTVTFLNSQISSSPLSISCKANDDYTVDNKLRIVSDTMELLDYGNDVSKNWIYLDPYGENTIQLSGGANGKFICEFPRKVGI